ncbi:uncharacterized protein DDB_G0271670-like [Ylistrum balloti]|uniref:uncharacterized protein DDB_G0271670-like n=1 Tax=Ylistrum balloti TaxID=509963 RepID=UPI0029058AC6|nr:uncharacterized protein DDB_G0271670-like [Ylistrum balloti]
MATVPFLLVCLVASVYSQSVTKTTETKIFVDPAGTRSDPLADAFHIAPETAEASLVPSHQSLNEITRNLQELPGNLPETLKKLLAGSPVETAVNEANQNSADLLSRDGNKIQHAFQLAQNNIVLNQFLNEKKKQMATQNLQDEILSRLLQQQQQQRQQELLKRQQQFRQGNTILSPIPDPSPQLTDNSGPNGLISTNLLSTNTQSFSSSGSNPFSTSSTGSSGGSSTGSSTSSSTVTSTRTTSTSTTSTSQNDAAADKNAKSKKETRKERLLKLKQKIKLQKQIAQMKAAKAAAKAKKERENAEQEQAEDLARQNEFNSAVSSPTTGVTSQDVLAQAGQNARAEAAINMAGFSPGQNQEIGEASSQIVSQTQITGTNNVIPGLPFGASFNTQNQLSSNTIGAPELPFGASFNSQNQLSSNTIGTPGLPFGASFNSQNQLSPNTIGTPELPFGASFSSQNQLSPNTIGTLDISGNAGMSTQANAMQQQQQMVSGAALTFAAASASRIPRGFFATVRADGTVVPDGLNYGTRFSQSAPQFVQLSSPSRYNRNTFSAPLLQTSVNPTVFMNAPSTTSYNMAPQYPSLVYNVPYSRSVFMNAPFTNNFSFNTMPLPTVTPI